MAFKARVLYRVATDYPSYIGANERIQQSLLTIQNQNPYFRLLLVKVEWPASINRMVQPITYGKRQKARIVEPPSTNSKSKEIPRLPRNATRKFG